MSVEDDIALGRTHLKQKLAELTSSERVIPSLDAALTHPSYANEVGGTDNQRLEFLGDAVLSLCVSEILSSRFPEANEGLLSRMRSALVNAEALADWAREENVGAALALGKGARTKPALIQTNVLADAVEAVVAAVYEAGGLPAARALVTGIIAPKLLKDSELASQDPKSELQERVQALGHETPRYRLTAMQGPEHSASFVIEVLVGELVLGVGEGRSKRLAERQAAEHALASDAFSKLETVRAEKIMPKA
jgi:ribonuclease III